MPDEARAGWHRADIIAALHKRGTNLQRLGLANGFARSTLAASLHRRHPRANALIAEAIEVPAAELWPHWYRAGDVLPSSSAKGARPGRSESSRIRRSA